MESNDLSNLLVHVGGELSIGWTDLQIHDHGVVTYTLEVDMLAGLPEDLRERIKYEFGWGNGYISIPEDHPFLALVPQIETTINIGQPYTFNSTFKFMNEHFPPSGNHWTYSTFGPVEGCEGMYATFGFDTAHEGQTAENWPRQHIVDTLEQFVTFINSYV